MGNFPKGFSAALLWSTGLDDHDINSNFGDEVGWFVGWAGSVKGLDLSLTLSQYGLYDMGRINDDLFGIYGTLGHSFTLGTHALTPYVYVEHDRPYSRAVFDYYTFVRPAFI